MPRLLFPSMTMLAVWSVQAAADPLPVQVIDGFSHPESVLITESAHYVSNFGAKMDPVAKDGDGFISVLDADGKMVKEKAFVGLDAPKGMALNGSTLYVADLDRIVGFDLTSGQETFVATLDCAQPCMLNDLAFAGERLVATDTMQGTLLHLDLDSKAFTRLADGMPGANGVAWDADRQQAVVVTFGEDFGGGHVFTWSETQGVQQLPDGPKGLFDGVAVLADGRLVLSDWISLTSQAGNMLIVDPATGDATTIATDRPIRTPADFALDESGTRLWIAATADNAVVVLTLP